MAFGQNTESKSSSWSIFWQPGSNWDFSNPKYTGLDDFSPYMLETLIRPEGYVPEFSRNTVRTLTNDFTILHLGVQYDFGERWAKSEKRTFSIRSGIKYLEKTWSQRTTDNFQQVHLDSTYNPNYDIIMQRDSFYTQSYSASFGNETLRWQNEFNVQRQITERFQWSFGIGIGASFYFNRRFLFNKSTAAYEMVSTSTGNELIAYQVDPYYSQYGAPYNNVAQSEIPPKTQVEESKTLKNQVGALAYIPLRISYQMGKPNKVLSHLFLACEAQIGYRIEEVVFKKNQPVFMLNHGFSLRYQI